MAAQNASRHARSSECPKRPRPVPERCGCGALWPCLRCRVGFLASQGATVELIAKVIDLPVRVVKRELRSYRRMLDIQAGLRDAFGKRTPLGHWVAKKTRPPRVRRRARPGA